MVVVASWPGLSGRPGLLWRCAQDRGVAGTSAARRQVVGGQSQRVRPEPAIGPARGRTRWAGQDDRLRVPTLGLSEVGTARRSAPLPTLQVIPIDRNSL